MFLLNLTAVEFLAIFTALSGIVVGLYLLSRTRKKQVVSTLRFWTRAQQSISTKHRRRIQQPLSLLLQLLSILLLLLALGQLRFGSRENSSRDHVLLLDTSSWMAAKSGPKTLLDEGKAKAKAYLKALPSTDRVMLVRAEGLASPATAMERDRDTLIRAIDQSRPGASALDLQQAFAFADQVRRKHPNPGEIVYVGGGRVGTQPTQVPRAIRVLPIETTAENVGLTKAGLRRTTADEWEIFVSARNYGSRMRRVPVVAQFGGATIGSTLLDLKPNALSETAMKFKTRAAGWVELRLLSRDNLTEDDRVIIEVPPLKTLRLAVFTSSPESWRPALQANPQVEATFHAPAAYIPKPEADAILIDRFAPPSPPQLPSISIDPPSQTRLTNQAILRWRPNHPISAGLRSQQFRLPSASKLTGETVIAETAAGPVIVTTKRSVVLGFNPTSPELRNDLATPLLIANILRWIEPNIFGNQELQTATVGSAQVTLDADIDPAQIQVLSGTQHLPFTLRGKELSFYAARPGTVRVISPDREQVLSLSLPEAGEIQWDTPASASTGLPGAVQQALSRDVWQLLATLAAIGLLAEYLLFGRRSVMKPGAFAEAQWRKAS